MKTMLKACIAGCLSAALSFSAMGLDLADGHPDTYIVKKGDTLWDISGLFLKSPWKWPQLWKANKHIENPHLIYPGDRLRLTYVNGSPRLELESRSGGRTVLPDGTVKIMPKVRVTSLADAIPAIALEKVNAFLTRSRILETDELKDAPYVIAGESRRIVSAAGDTLYARGDFDESGNRIFGVYRRGKVFTDPQTKEPLGLEAVDIGDLKLMSVADSIGTLNVLRSNEEIRIKDRLLPHIEQKIDASFYPSTSETNASGVIMAVEGGVSQIGTLDIVTLNKGQRDGVTNGNVFAIDKSSEVIKDPITGEFIKLPNEQAGLMMVFRSFNKMSYALILEAGQPLNVGDEFRNP